MTCIAKVLASNCNGDDVCGAGKITRDLLECCEDANKNSAEAHCLAATQRRRLTEATQNFKISVTETIDATSGETHNGFNVERLCALFFLLRIYDTRKHNRVDPHPRG